jgi:hypothetical protein
MRKTSVLSLSVVFVIASIVTMLSDRGPFEEVAERASIAEQASARDTRCPLSHQYFDEGDLKLLRICVAYGLSAYEAAQRYPNSAAKVFAVYGEEPEFQKVLDRYGSQVVPVVAYFVENGSFELQARQTVGETVNRLWAGRWPNWDTPQLTREQICLIAIHEIAKRGDEILAEFEIVDGVAKPKPVTESLLEAKQFLLGGVGDVETVLVRGERLPTWKEAGLAALDVTVVAGGAGALAKVVRVGRDALVERGAGRLAIEGAYETIGAVGRTGWRVAPYALAYVVVTRPTLILSLGGWVAEQSGLNPRVGIFAIAFVGMLVMRRLLIPLIRCVRTLGRLFGGRVPAPALHQPLSGAVTQVAR